MSEDIRSPDRNKSNSSSTRAESRVKSNPVDRSRTHRKTSWLLPPLPLNLPCLLELPHYTSHQ